MLLTNYKFLKDVSIEYNIDIDLVISCLKNSVEKHIGSSKVSVEFNNNKLSFYEIIINRFSETRKQELKIKQGTYQQILDTLIDSVREISFRQKNKALASFVKNEKAILEGKITGIRKNGFEILTKFGYGFCPKQNVFIKDIKTNKMQINKKMYFHIFKFRLRGKNVLILDRKHINILYREVKDVMGDCGVFSIKRNIGKEVFIFCTKQPSKKQIKTLAQTTNTKISIQLRS